MYRGRYPPNPRFRYSRRYLSGGSTIIPANVRFPSRSDRVTIYGRPNCPYTTNAVSIAQQKMSPVTFYDITGKESTARAQLATKFPEVAVHMTVPLVFVNDEDGIRFIGGNDSFVLYLRQRDQPPKR